MDMYRNISEKPVKLILVEDKPYCYSHRSPITEDIINIELLRKRGTFYNEKPKK